MSVTRHRCLALRFGVGRSFEARGGAGALALPAWEDGAISLACRRGAPPRPQSDRGVASTCATECRADPARKVGLGRWARHTACLTAFGALLFCAQAAEPALRNDRYALSVQPDGSVRVEVAGLPPQTIQPTFTVMVSKKDPGYLRNATHPNYQIAPRVAVRWQNCEERLEELLAWLKSDRTRAGLRVTEDAKGRREWSTSKGAWKLGGHYAGGTVNPFAAGMREDLRAVLTSAGAGRLLWSFKAADGFELSAEVALPPGAGDPQVTARLKAKQPAYFSVIFTGMPAWANAGDAIIPQECLDRSGRCGYVMAECDLRLPRAQLMSGEGCQALVMEPDAGDTLQPGPANSRFGLMVQRSGETLKPVALAPLMGGAGSHLKPGDSCALAVRCVFRPGDWKETHRHIARDIYRFRDLRDNSGPGSLNGTLERLMDFLSDRNGKNYAMWSDEQKYFDYWSDRSGLYKPFSPLFGLGLALVTDDEAFYRKRALPAVEFALSRSYNVFAPYETLENGQAHSAERELGDTYLGFAQLVELNGLFHDRVPAIRALAESKRSASHVPRDLLAQFALTGDGHCLTTAMERADSSYKRHPDGKGWPPALGGDAEAFMDYLDLFEATGQKRYLDAAAEGAYGVALGLNLSPAVPEATLTVDEGGRAPIHAHSFGRHKRWGFPPPKPLPVPEQSVPAWRPALVGVPGIAYRGEYWMNAHAQLLRVAALSGDDFLRDLARWGMVGRFGSYPGDNCSQRSLVAERPDAADRPIWECTHATINPGHAWEFAGAVLDFLVTDAFQRSGGAIDFPSRSMPHCAFRTKTYGDRPGRFYDERDVNLWLPRSLLICSNPQLDYLAGYSGDRLCLAFWNQSFEKQSGAVTLNPQLVETAGSGVIRVWRDNKPAEPVRLSDVRLALDASPKGIVAFVIPGVRPKPSLQAKIADPSSLILGPESRANVVAPFGKVHALLITLGRGLTTAFVYTDALPENVIEAKLRFRQGDGEWQERTDSIFPYEFSVDVDEVKGAFEGELEVKNAARQIQRSEVITLRVSGKGKHQ